MIILAWLYYSSYYILMAIVITLMMNRLVKKLWLTPLIMNAIASLLLYFSVKLNWITGQDATYAMYFNYMPVILTSIITNLIVYAAIRLKK